LEILSVTFIQLSTTSPYRGRRSNAQRPRRQRLKSPSKLQEHTPLKTNMTLEKSPCSIGNTSSNGGYSIVILVFGGVTPNVPSNGNIYQPPCRPCRKKGWCQGWCNAFLDIHMVPGKPAFGAGNPMPFRCRWNVENDSLGVGKVSNENFHMCVCVFQKISSEIFMM